VKHWLPELGKVSADKIHEPGKLSPDQQQRFNVRLGIDYPDPMVDLFQSADENKRIYQQALDRAVVGETGFLDQILGTKRGINRETRFLRLGRGAIGSFFPPQTHPKTVQ